MTPFAIVLSLKTAIFLISLEAVIYMLGVVWRVEKRLDLAAKLFLAAIISFTLSQIFNFGTIENWSWFSDIKISLELLFAIFFLWGTLELRLMIRKLDGEIKDKDKEEQ